MIKHLIFSNLLFESDFVLSILEECSDMTMNWFENNYMNQAKT